MSNCPLPEPPPTYEPDFLVEAWLANSAAHVQAHNVDRWARYAPELGWRSVLAVLELPDAQQHLSALAHALRMLISRFGSQFIERIEVEANVSPAFRRCLAEVWPDPTFPIPEELWPRLTAAAGRPIGPMAPHMAELFAEMPDLSEVASWDPHPPGAEEIPELSPDDLASQANAWVEYHQTFWAWEELERLYREDGLDAAWPFVLALVEKGDDGALGALGAGILEDMVRRDGPLIIDRIEAEAAVSPRFRFCLSHVWRGPTPSAIWDRVVAAVAEEPQRG
jgi:hypothetical protein